MWLLYQNLIFLNEKTTFLFFKPLLENANYQAPQNRFLAKSLPCEVSLKFALKFTTKSR